ncbi:MAG: DUF2339 domain-containing protein [Planctomycetes bacterium]|nr:DUF2339 domain-containing protein [Planctomycetota bacterium]
MLEIMLALLGFSLLAGLVIAVLVVPIVALARSRRVPDLEARLSRLETDLRRLRRSIEDGLRGDTQATAVEPNSAHPDESSTAVAAEPIMLAAVPGESSDIGSIEVARARKPSLDLEAFIGGRGLGWIAVILLLLAGGFFLQQVFEGGFIGELGRVAIGLAIGAGLCFAGWRFQLRGWHVFSQMSTAGGIVLLYLATFATFSFYHLMPREHAVFFLIAVILEAAALAILYEAPAIAIMAVIGGLLTPLLLHSDRDQYLSLFIYLAMLNTGVVALSWLRPGWPVVSTLALAGTHILFWGWYNVSYHPMKLGAAMAFQGTLFGLYLVQAVVGHALTGRRAGIEDLIRLLANAFLVSLAGYILLESSWNLWLGTFAVALAALYAILTWLLLARHADDPRQALTMLAIAMAFLAAVFPLQADAAWIAVGWAAQGLALWWFGLRISSMPLRGLASALLTLAAGRLLLVDTWRAHDRPFVPLFNAYGLPALAVSGSLIVTALLTRRMCRGSIGRDAALPQVFGLAGMVLLWLVLSVEAYDYFWVQARFAPEQARLAQSRALDDLPGQAAQHVFEREIHLRQSAQTALSILWAVFAATLLAVGLRRDLPALRWAALGLFGLTLGKVLIVDMERLPGFYRVLAFLMLSIMMAAGAWGYQKVKRSLTSAKETHNG